MERLTRQASRDARTNLAIIAARSALSNVDPRAHPDANALAVCGWIRATVRYAPERPETFADLRRLLQFRVGDCDCMGSAVAALLLVLRYQVRFVLGIGNRWHLWVQAWSPRLGRWIDLDASTWELEPGGAPDSARFTELRYYPVRY